MMRDCKKPAVGHNLTLDLAFSLNAFARYLPPAWVDYKLLIAEWWGNPLSCILAQCLVLLS